MILSQKTENKIRGLCPYKLDPQSSWGWRGWGKSKSL